jgi:hypothetical protein
MQNGDRMAVSHIHGKQNGAMAGRLRNLYREGTRMLTHLFTGLFHKHCPLCGKEVRAQSEAAVQRLGKWFCSEGHADIHELNLYEALSMVYRRHVASHGGHVPLPEALHLHFPPRHSQELTPLEPDHEKCSSTHA